MGKLKKEQFKMKIWIGLFAGAMATCGKWTHNWEDCRDVCRQTGGCEFWDWRPDDDNWCYLKLNHGWTMTHVGSGAVAGDRGSTVWFDTFLHGGDLPDNCNIA